MAFDPDAYLNQPKSGGFDPDAFLSESPQKPQKPSGLDRALDIGAGVLESATGLLDLPIHAVNLGASGIEYAGETLFGPEFDVPRLGTLKDVNLIEKATARQVPEGESALQDFARTAVEWGAGGIPNLLRKASVRPDVYMGLGAATGEALGGETGELVGGVAGALRGLKQGDISKVDERAINFIKANADNPDKAIQNLQTAVARGERGTLADLTQDAGIYNVEAGVRAGTKQRRAVDAEISAREHQIAEEVSDVFGAGGGTKQAQEIARERIQERKQTVDRLGEQRLKRALAQKQQTEAGIEQAESAAQAQLKATEGVAQEAKEAVDTALKPAQASRRLAKGYETLEKKIRQDVERPAWERFEQQEPIDIVQLRREMKRAVGKMPAAKSADLIRKYNTVLRHVGEWENLADPRDVQYVMSAIKDITNSAKATGNYGTLEKGLGDLGDIIDRQLRDPMSGDAYREAVAATREKYLRTKPEKLSKARLNEEIETFAKRVGVSDEQGAATARLVKQAGSPAIEQRFQDVLKARAKKEGLDENWLAKHDETLDVFPDLKRQMEEAVAASKSADEAATILGDVTKAGTKEREALTKALEAQRKETRAGATKLKKAFDKSIMAEFGRSPNKVVDKILRDPDGAETMNRLLNRMEREGGREAFKGAIRDRFMQIVAPSPEGVTRVKPVSIGKFEDMRPTLVDSGVISSDEANEIYSKLSKSSSMDDRRKAAAIRLEDRGGELENLLSSAGAAGLMTALTGSQSLMVGSAVRRGLKRILLRKKSDPKVITQIENFMANPESFFKAARGIRDPEKAQKAILTAIVGLGQATDLMKEE